MAELVLTPSTAEWLVLTGQLAADEFCISLDGATCTVNQTASSAFAAGVVRAAALAPLLSAEVGTSEARGLKVLTCAAEPCPPGAPGLAPPGPHPASLMRAWRRRL